nr:flavodoxin-dependent (E)-4-hydroxy-3-methylbut-2-enyl-diphosphate synthase [Opitutaceae bacterium]
VQRMQQEAMHYPLHLGVTEAGDGEDGRIKSAIGIGSLLFDGLGDTIRVSLTEDSVYEIPVARAIADKAMSLWRLGNAGGLPANPELRASGPRSHDSIDPYHFTRRETTTLHLGEGITIGPGQPPRVIVRTTLDSLQNLSTEARNPKLVDTPNEGLLVAVSSVADLAALHRPTGTFLVLELAPALFPADLKAQAACLPAGTVLLRKFSSADAVVLAGFAQFAREHQLVIAAEILPADFAALTDTLRPLSDAPLILTLSGKTAATGHAIGAYRQLAEALHQDGSRAPIWIRNTAATAVRAEPAFLSKLLEASFLTGALLCDGIADAVSIETETDAPRALRLAYNVLQGAGARSSKTEFVACPSCGRTLFDLQTTTQRIRAQTGHLKGVKIAIMGCIVNGPGEMADADFGYVGGAPGKINLYVGKQCVQYNIPQTEADARLIALIREHGKWVAPV